MLDCELILAFFLTHPFSSPSHFKIDFPDTLPVSMRREEIMKAIEEHQVVIVCGETGSGKTTQLPKMALALGRGRMNAVKGERPRWIGHTQPRRIAATSVAKRIAEELRTPLGEVVGYKVRFNDQLGPEASIKLMTDGILLAETQGDPLLNAYDTIIIDEAHERSLNIDFLLGYLKEILPRRPDLKVIVTSATIDAERFADHFASIKGPAPVIQVSGRTFPVEVRYQPFEESRDYGMNEAIADALDELWRNPLEGGDVLVFLPGEREIREAADHLRDHLKGQIGTSSAEVLPLFARLTQAEQERIFTAHSQRRVVLATNVAETSLTVPGIRFVIDSGLARVKRYSYRSKVEQLLIEPISRAAANQRAGRCGRVANGICIRLFSEEDFNARSPFTDPEILRSSLAGVILRMKSLRLGDVERFSFLEPPKPKAITDGYQLLNELGAMDEGHELTPLGAELSKLPLDPRVGRMILEARERGALDEVLIIASALSVPDVRDRPLSQQSQADQAHAKFKDDKSEFTGYVTLWHWLKAARGDKETPHPGGDRHDKAQTKILGKVQGVGASAQRPSSPAKMPLSVKPVMKAKDFAQLSLQLSAQVQAERSLPKKGEKSSDRALENALENASKNTSTKGVPTTPSARSAPSALSRSDSSLVSSPSRPLTKNQTSAQPRLSQRQFDQLLRQNFLNPRRLREWRDVYTQLLSVVHEQRWKLNARPASYEQLHLSLLSGLLGNIGFKPEEEDYYLGARGIKFYKHPGAHLRKKPGRWIVAAEIVETTRVFGRAVANIEPQWLEELGAHLLKKQLLDPHWEKRFSEVAAYERATLYGLVVYSGRRVPYARLDMRAAREIFIREALVHLDWDSKLKFLSANQKLIHEIEEMEHKSRRQDVLVDDELIFAFYDELLPGDVYSGQTLEKWYKAQEALDPQNPPLHMSKSTLMRHEAKGVTYQSFPPTLRMGGVDCKVDYLHEPGATRDGMSVTLPLFVLNQVQEDRAEWLVPGMLKEKIQALLKSLPQRPRSRLVPLPESASVFYDLLCAPEKFAHGSLLQALLKLVRDKTQLDIKLSDFKTDTLSVHLFCHFQVVDEHQRMLAQGRNLGTLKAQLSSQARGAFQALAGLKAQLPLSAQPSHSPVDAPLVPGKPFSDGSSQGSSSMRLGGTVGEKINIASSRHESVSHEPPLKTQGSGPKGLASPPMNRLMTTWDFEPLPELMEIAQGAQSLVGFPALVDQGDGVKIELFDEPDVAKTKMAKGLERLFVLQLKEAIKFLQKSLPSLVGMNMMYLGLNPKAASDQLFTDILSVSVGRAFLQEPWPRDKESFEQRLQEGRGRFNLIAQEVSKSIQVMLSEHQNCRKKLKDMKLPTEVAQDVETQLTRMLGARFITQIPYAQWQHLPRYLKAIQMRLDKFRADPARDQLKLSEIKPLESKFWRWMEARKGQEDERSREFRWLLEELRVSVFAQELKTPQPVSVKRLDKAWALLQQ